MGRWNEALASYTASKDIFEEHRNSDGESHQTLVRLAEAYRTMADVTQNMVTSADRKSTQAKLWNRIEPW